MADTLTSMSGTDRIKSLIKSALPASVVAAMRRRSRAKLLSSVKPISRCFGLDRGGTPIDRYYIATFLGQHTGDIRGRVIEIGDREYSTRFGGDRITQSDVLHVDGGQPGVTIVGDLVTGRGIPEGAFDCFICTQTLMFTYDVQAAITTLHRSLKPGGVSLVTVAGISQICRFDMDHWGDFWRFTSMAARRLFADAFGQTNVAISIYGNSFAAVSLLQGLKTEELTREELDKPDDDYEVIIAVRAVRGIDKGGGSR